MFYVDDVERFMRLIRAMDTAFVEKIEKRNKQKENLTRGNKASRHN